MLSTRRSTRRLQTSLAKADHYPFIAQYGNNALIKSMSVQKCNRIRMFNLFWEMQSKVKASHKDY